MDTSEENQHVEENETKILITQENREETKEEES